MDLITRRATFAPATLDLEAGTVEVVLATAGNVRRNGHIERLAIGPEHVTLPARLPLLDTHRQGSIADVKGHVNNLRFGTVDGRAAILATAHISDPVALAAVGRGDVTGVSVGFYGEKWVETTEAGVRVRVATKWAAAEASLCAIPTDESAIIRSFPVPDTEITPEAQRLETRTAIRGIARAAGLDSTWADNLIDEGADETRARAEAFDAVMARPRPTIRTASAGMSSEDPAVIVTRQAEALAQRMGGPQAGDSARQYLSLGFADLARDALTRAGVAGVSTMGREALLTRAMHTTSDFPTLLTEAGSRVLAAAYTTAASPLLALAARRTAADFRPLAVVKLGGFGALREVSEAGEITYTTSVEAGESYAIRTFGRIFALSRKMLINDDTGAFGRITAELGKAAAETEASTIASLLLGNPVMDDGHALFSAAHANLASVGGAINEATVSAARLAMRTQTGLTGERIGVTPRYLVCGPALETEAEKFLTTIAAGTTEATNVFAGKLSLLVEPRILGNAWFLFADPASLPTLEYASLASAPGPQITSKDGWEVLGREFRCVLDFGVGVVEHRGAYRNAGVA